MQSQQPHGEKWASATTSAQPPPGHHVSSIPPPEYSTSAFPNIQPGWGAYPTAPVLNEPTSAVPNTDTTILIRQPQTVVAEPPREWSTGLCDCCEDKQICLLGFISWLVGVPFLAFLVGDTAEQNACTGLFCAGAIRTKIRLKHNIQGSIFKDGLAVCCCHLCALCQMQREMKMHGI